MIDVVFNPSIEGSLRVCRAQKYLEDIQFVADLNCMMDIGRISEGIESEYRITLPDRLYLYGDHDSDGSEEDYRSTGERNLKYWEALIAFLQKGMPVRIWYSDSPQEYCGLLHVCSLLEQYDSKAFLIKCPEAIKGQNEWFFVHGWGQLNPEQITDYMQNCHEASKEEITAFADRWRELVKENAPLRAVISGQAVSVPESFYDFLIKREFPFKSMKQSRIIGNIMDKNGIGIYGFVYEMRIQKLIDSGEIIVEKSANRDNDRILSTVSYKR